ncbi:MAG: ABC transporter substrate-binding protein [Amaricoccus sp.]|uniref:ABC transporter substrate-binding protein n=1 Tax=Amaricoccus sp. TaxID=1872485 RepID=UPI0039E58580
MTLESGRRRTLRAGLLALVLLGAGAALAGAQEVPGKPEPGPIKMGIEPWLGYGQWHIADKKGLFAAQGLDDVEVVNFNTDADINAALAAGQLQAGNIATHTAMNFIANGLPIKIVALLDVSKTADAILTDGSATDIAGLKGKQVAYEEGTTSDILLNYALAAHGMTITDIEKVPMPASDAGAALIARQVPAAVTYEPYLTLAMQQDPKVKMIYSAGEDPGLVSDVFVVRDEFLKERPGAVAALLRAWDAALADYKADTAGGRAIIAEAVGAKPDELATAFDGVVYYSMQDNAAELPGAFTTKIVPDVEAAAVKAGILAGPVDMSGAIDARFVDAVGK